jgi:hypothetical protein
MIATLQKLNFGCYRGILDLEGSECIMTTFCVLSISKVSTVCMVKKFMSVKSQEHWNPGVQWLSGLFEPLIFVCCNEDFSSFGAFNSLLLQFFEVFCVVMVFQVWCTVSFGEKKLFFLAGHIG